MNEFKVGDLVKIKFVLGGRRWSDWDSHKNEWGKIIETQSETVLDGEEYNIRIEWDNGDHSYAPSRLLLSEKISNWRKEFEAD